MVRIIRTIILLMVFASCERITFKEYALPENDGKLSWNQVRKNAEWSKRYDHAAVSFNGRLWIFGGYNPGQVKGDTYYEDTWSSLDGKTWELITGNAVWKGRRGHRVIVFDDGSGEALFLVGGFVVDESTGHRQYANDIWKSADGLYWEEIKPRTYPGLQDSTNWMPRMHHALVSANHNGTDFMYLIGGRTLLENHNVKYASVYFNDVWRSSDGVAWEKLANNDYGIRAEHAAVTDPHTGRIYIQGGVHGVIFESKNKGSHPLPDWQDLWYSDDGITWKSMEDTSIVEDRYLFRSGHQIVNFQGRLWALPGKTVSNEHYEFARYQYFSTWTYQETNEWDIDTKGTDIDARHSYPALIHNEKIWILGGFTGSNAQMNDVWAAEL